MLDPASNESKDECSRHNTRSLLDSQNSDICIISGPGVNVLGKNRPVGVDSVHERTSDKHVDAK